MQSLTFKQARVRDYIANFLSIKGYAPSFEEIGEALGLRSLATVSKHVEVLQRKGAIKLKPGRARSIEVIAQDGIAVICPECRHEFRMLLTK